MSRAERTEPVRVALVGHCGPDAYALRSAVRRALGDVEVLMVGADEQLGALAGSGVLLLVNRALDGDFPDADGVELIARVAKRGGRAMLISNFADAQAAAEAAGARPGFGKRDMNSEGTKERLRKAIA